MSPELRDAIGLAVYKQDVKHFNPAQGTAVPWDELLEDTREHYRVCGEAAVIVHNEWMYEHLMKQIGIRDERGNV